MATTLPSLPQVEADSLGDAVPVPLIRTGEDVTRWHRSRGFETYMLFLHRLNESVVGCMLGDERLATPSPAVHKMISALDSIESWIDEVPPQPTPQRFGNLAFREWGKLLEERSEALLRELLPESLEACIPHITPYLVRSFGSFGRIDYGSGHELCFAIFLLCLLLLRFFQPNPDEERLLVLGVFERYMRVVWRLQDVYKLEPAGSQGVWGLDDYHFLPYLWGSAQLRNEANLLPASVLAPPPLAPTNLYYLCINRIHALKHGGPFHEHSPQLYSIATGVTLQSGGWRKVNVGMMKMYLAEVLGKRVVVQHTPLGSIISWDEVEDVKGKGTDVLGVVTTTPPPSRRAGPTGRMGPPPAPVASYAAVAPPTVLASISGPLPVRAGSTVIPTMRPPPPP